MKEVVVQFRVSEDDWNQFVGAVRSEGISEAEALSMIVKAATIIRTQYRWAWNHIVKQAKQFKGELAQ